jgi:hypothetical protein
MTFGLRRTLHALVLAAAVLVTVFAPAASASHSGSPAVVPGATIAGRVPVIGTPNLGGGNLQFHGGPVMHTNTSYAIYWVPSGYSISANYKSLLDGFLQNVAAASGSTSNVYASDTQYYDNNGSIAYSSTFGGSYTDTAAFPANGCSSYNGLSKCLSDAQLQAEITKVITARGWTRGPSSVFFLFTPRNVGSCDSPGSCAFTTFCAYHGYYGSGQTLTMYANQPYTATNKAACWPGQSPNGDDADGTINVVSHEHNEAITDPQLSAWWDSAGYENGDKCAWIFGSPLGTTSYGQYNQVIGTGKYYLQEEWSNSSSSCVQTYGVSGKPSITSFTPTQGKRGNTVTITGSKFTGATSVKFGGGATASFTVVNDSSITATVPKLALSGPISVTTPGGTATSAASFTVLPKVSSFTPTSGPIGTLVTINGGGFTGATAVKFNGVPAVFTVVSAAKITATVPAGAATGKIQVVTPVGSATNATLFTVT